MTGRAGSTIVLVVPRRRRWIVTGRLTPPARRIGCSQNRNFDFVQRLVAALGGDVERAEQFDFVVEQLDAHWPQPVGCKNVDDAAAMRELARQLDGAGGMKAAFDQPAQKLVDVDPLGLPNGARGRG